MYRYVITLVLTVFLMLCLCACNKNIEDAPAITTDSTVETAEVSTETATEETINGVVMNPFADDSDMDKEATEATEDMPQQTEQPGVTESTKPTEKPGDSTEPTSSTEPAATTEPTIPEETKPVADDVTPQQLTEFEKYNAMSGEEQMAFMQSFETIEAFFTWLNNAKAEYEAANPGIEISGGEIDVGEIIGK